MKLISLIIPCFNEQESLPAFYEQTAKTAGQMQEVEFEFIFVDDGSEDNTLKILRAMREGDRRVRFISFSRNFGKEAAMYAGLREARGDFAAIIDADLQHPPELLPEMYKAVTEQGFDCAAARRTSRGGESIIKSFFAKIFYKIANKMSKINIENSCDYRLMSRKMVDAVLSLSEYNRFSKGIFSYVGFKTKWLDYENRPRFAGKTKWSIWRLFLYSVDGIVAFSTVPLAAASFIGVLFCIAAFIFACVIVIKTLIFGDPVAGFPTLSCLILFIGGVQLLVSGILGEYLSKVYLETKKRPLYVIREQDCDTDKESEGSE